MKEFIGMDFKNISDCDEIQDIVIKIANETGFSTADVAESIVCILSNGLKMEDIFKNK